MAPPDVRATSGPGAPTPLGEPGQATGSRDRWFAVAIAMTFAIVASVATARHEMWRDELDAWLACRDAPNPLALLRAIRYGGHPALWYLLVWPLTRLTRDPAAMQVLHVVIGACGAFVVARYAPAPRWIRAVAALGYFPLYEYGTIARSYGLGLLGLVSACALFPRRHHRPWLLGAVLLLTANTQALAMILCVAFLGAWTLDAWSRRASTSRAAWGGIALAAAGALVSGVQMVPPSSGSYVPQWFLRFSLPDVKQVIALVARAHLPLPALQPAFWQTWALDSVSGHAELAWVLGLAIAFGVGAAVARSRVALVYFAAGLVGTLLLFYTKHPGFLRHHGYLYVCSATALWLSRLVDEPLAHPRLPAAVLAARRMVRPAVGAILVVHLVAAAVAVVADYRYVFSGSKATAEMIREGGLAPLPMIGSPDYAVMAVVGHLDKDAAYYPAGRRWGSHIIWDEARAVPYDFWEEADALASRRRSNVVAVIADPGLVSVPAAMAPRRRFVGCRRSEVVLDESFCVFVLAPPSSVPPGASGF